MKDTVAQLRADKEKAEAHAKEWETTAQHLLERAEKAEKACANEADLLSEGLDLLNEVAAYGSCQCDIPNGETCIACQCALFHKRVRESTCGQGYVSRETVRETLTVQGQDLHTYLLEQFPGVAGHLPVREMFARLQKLVEGK